MPLVLQWNLECHSSGVLLYMVRDTDTVVDLPLVLLTRLLCFHVRMHLPHDLQELLRRKAFHAL